MRAYALPTNAPIDDFNRYAIAALVAVVGTGLTGIASVYSATRQSATASQVAEYNGYVAQVLAVMKHETDQSLKDMDLKIGKTLTAMKEESDKTLATLKVGLDLGHVAYRELFGAATIYFHALRSFALGSKWDEAALKSAEDGMIAATPRIIHVSKEMRDEWFNFWQNAQAVRQDKAHWEGRWKKVTPQMIGKAISDHSLRDTHSNLEKIASKRMRLFQTGD